MARHVFFLKKACRVTDSTDKLVTIYILQQTKKTRMALEMVASLLLGLLLLFNLGQATTGTQVHLHGLNSAASWNMPFTRISTCTTTSTSATCVTGGTAFEITLTAFQGRIQAGPGPGENQTFLFLEVREVRYGFNAPNQTISDLVGTSSTVDYRVNVDLGFAELRANITAVDSILTGQVTIQAVVSWNATDPASGLLSPLIPFHYVSRSSSGGATQMIYTAGIMRSAKVGGSLCIGKPPPDIFPRGGQCGLSIGISSIAGFIARTESVVTETPR